MKSKVVDGELADFQLHMMATILERGPWRLPERQAQAEQLLRHACLLWCFREKAWAMMQLRAHQQAAAWRQGQDVLRRRALDELHSRGTRTNRHRLPPWLLQHAFARLRSAASRRRAVALPRDVGKLVALTVHSDMVRRREQLLAWAGRSRWLTCLLYTSPSPRDGLLSRMPSSA